VILAQVAELFITTDLQDLIVAQLEHLRVDGWKLHQIIGGVVLLIHKQLCSCQEMMA
jgi:hypothetical protein